MSSRKIQRNQAGSLSLLLPLAILLVIIGLGMFAMDVSHNITVRTEMQNGTDAAALAGAQDLTNPAKETSCPNTAIHIAETNTADGRAISNTSHDTTVMANYEMNPAENSGTCYVDSNMWIQNMFAKIVGRPDVGVKSAATGWSSVTGIDRDQAFPLAVSLDTTVGNRPPLYTRKVGDIVTFDINSQQFKNAAFTSFTIPNPNAQWLTGAIDQALGFAPVKPGWIPAMDVGDNMSFTNGVAQQKQLAAGEYIGRLKEFNDVALPVMLGDPPYNQNRKCVGFITVKILDVKINGSGGQVETFTAKITKGIIKGKGGKPTQTGNYNKDNGMQTISAGTVKLVI